jgi:murein hydrolase activator
MPPSRSLPRGPWRGSDRPRPRRHPAGLPFRLAALLLPVLLLTSPGAAPAAAQVPLDDTERELAESQRRLQQVRAEREELRQEMTRIRSRVGDLSTEVSNLGRQVDASATVLRELEFQVAQREVQIEQITLELDSTRTRLEDRRSILHRRLRDIHRRGPLATAEVLLAADSFADLLNRYRYLFLVARHDRRLADEVAELERRLVARDRALRSSLQELEAARRDRLEAHEQLAAVQGQQRRALDSARDRERATAERIAQLERDESRLNELLTLLETRRRAAAPAVATLSPRSMGTLPWPAEGRLLYDFGRVTQPNGTVIRWNGIGIGAPAGSPVRAVEAGSVVVAGPFEGYGPSVIVSHGGGYYTLYLYLGEIHVAEGAAIGRGDPIGTVGAARTAEGPRVEFQVRVPGGQAVDPLEWLRQR